MSMGPDEEEGLLKLPALQAEALERPHRQACYDCFKPLALCICGRVPRVANRTAITILQHPRERFHAVGTARIARLGLERIRVAIPRGVVTHDLSISPVTAEGYGLLFPGEGSRDLSQLAQAEMPAGLVVLDGTWAHARRLHSANPWLDTLPRYHVRPAAPTRYRIRKAPRPSYVSTIEAIVQALRIIEPDTRDLDGLLDSFEAMIDDQIAYSHRSPRKPERKIERQATGAASPTKIGSDRVL